VNRFSMMMFAAALAGALQAQDNPLSTEARQAYNGVKNNVTKMAEKMPEENYGFQPVTEIRTFGALMGHIADAQMGACSAVNGEQKMLNASKKTAKADLVAALKESFTECDKAFESLTDASANLMVKSRRGQRSKLGTLMGVVTHSNEEYGYGAIYLRLKGVVPPSSEGR
jgi:hypothetical protein